MSELYFINRVICIPWFYIFTSPAELKHGPCSHYTTTIAQLLKIPMNTSIITNKQQQEYRKHTHIAQCIVEGEPIPETDRCTWSHIHTPNTHRYCTWKAFSITVYFSAATGNNKSISDSYTSQRVKKCAITTSMTPTMNVAKLNEQGKQELGMERRDSSTQKKVSD